MSPYYPPQTPYKVGWTPQGTPPAEYSPTQYPPPPPSPPPPPTPMPGKPEKPQPPTPKRKKEREQNLSDSKRPSLVLWIFAVLVPSVLAVGGWLIFEQQEKLEMLENNLREQYRNLETARQELRQVQQDLESLRHPAADNSQAHRQSRENLRYSVPHNLDLAVRRNGRTLYFQTAGQYVREQGDTKLGVVIINDGVRFILALDDLGDGEYFNWDAAMNRFGRQLPTRSQAEAWASQNSRVITAIESYGGSLSAQRHYWTKTECDSTRSYFLNTRDRCVSEMDKTYTLRVRAVYPLR